MLIFALILILAAIGLGIFALRKPGHFGNTADEVERRHPEANWQKDDLLNRRSDDGVGGEGG